MSYQQQQFQPQHPVPPQFGAAPARPPVPKKKHTWIAWTAATGGAFVLGIGVGAAGGGGTTNSAAGAPKPAAVTQTVKVPGPQTTKTVTAEPAAKPAVAPSKPAPPVCGADKNAPCTVKVGQSFTLGKHQTLGGWKVREEYGMFSVSGKVKNVSDETSTAFIHLKFLKGAEVLGNVSCYSGDLEPGQVETLNCVPDGTFSKKYDRVTAEATF